MDKNNYMMHFSKDERSFVERCTDWVSRALNYQIITTPFLNPREQYILETLVNREDELTIDLDGGYNEAERCRAVLGYPFLFNEQQRVESISFLRATSRDNVLFNHRDVLGSLLGLGIKREKIGDISTHEMGCDLVIAKEIVSYIEFSLQQIKRTPVHTEPILRESFLHPKDNTQERLIFVTSMRLDTILAESLRSSRSKMATYIQTGKCQVNWQIINRPSHVIQSGDVLSVRGFGRVTIRDNLKMTKKGRYRLLVELYI